MIVKNKLVVFGTIVLFFSFLLVRESHVPQNLHIKTPHYFDSDAATYKDLKVDKLVKSYENLYNKLQKQVEAIEEIKSIPQELKKTAEKPQGHLKEEIKSAIDSELSTFSEIVEKIQKDYAKLNEEATKRKESDQKETTKLLNDIGSKFDNMFKNIQNVNVKFEHDIKAIEQKLEKIPSEPQQHTSYPSVSVPSAKKSVEQPDWAIFSMGGKVIRHSERFMNIIPPKNFWENVVAKLKTLIFDPRINKNVVVTPTPEVLVGNCLALKGSRGWIEILIAEKIYPTAFTIDHPLKSQIPDPEQGNASAPKIIKVYGMGTPKGKKESVLAREFITTLSFDVNDQTETFKTFEIPQEKIEEFVAKKMGFDHFRFEIQSNNGDSNKTCVYRIRIHGKKMKQ